MGRGSQRILRCRPAPNGRRLGGCQECLPGSLAPLHAALRAQQARGLWEASHSSPPKLLCCASCRSVASCRVIAVACVMAVAVARLMSPRP
jgi:hypothetical protein